MWQIFLIWENILTFCRRYFYNIFEYEYFRIGMTEEHTKIQTDRQTRDKGSIEQVALTRILIHPIYLTCYEYSAYIASHILYKDVIINTKAMHIRLLYLIIFLLLYLLDSYF